MQKTIIYGIYHKEYNENDYPEWSLICCASTEEKARQIISRKDIPQMYIIERLYLFD